MGGSSSNRRKNRQNRYYRPTAPVVSPTAQTLDYSHLEITTGKGYDLLRKSGWQPTSPSTPVPECAAQSPVRDTLTHVKSAPIPIIFKHGRAGIGAQTDKSQPASFTPHWQKPIVSPALVRCLADMDIFDPLRPTCQFDSSHVVANLKALHKHEQTCPANPDPRPIGRRPSLPTFNSNMLDIPLASSLPAPSPNQFGALMDDQMSDSEHSDTWSSISDSESEDETEVVEEPNMITLTPEEMEVAEGYSRMGLGS